MEYTGYRIIHFNDEELAKFYSTKTIEQELNLNEYIILVDDYDDPFDYYRYTNKGLVQLKYPVLDNAFTGQMKPRNAQQYCAMDLLKQRDIPIKLITGKFGSGKSMMCIVAALEALLKNEFDKIIFVRNNVQVKDTDALGALPGDIFDKTLPYIMPMADHCGGIDGIKMLIEQEQLEVIPLAYLRGRSIRNAIIYSMESENLTKEHIQLMMGRIDTGSQLWLDGDFKQRDRIAFEKSRGLEIMVERLKGEEAFGYVHLVKSERSKVAALADRLD